MSRVVVIGAGLAGLATACRLSGSGHDVTVLERDDRPGGRNGLLQRDGFSFDTGPTVLTMRELVADTLVAAGTDIDDVLPMRRLDPAYAARFADGSTLHVRHGHDAMRTEIAEQCGAADAAAFDDFADWLQQLYEVELPHFIDRNLDTPLDLARSPGALVKLVRLGGFGRLGGAVHKFFADTRLHRLFGFQAMYAGLPPDDALAIYAIITYMDCILGVWFPEGGMHALPRALAAAAEKAGATFRYDATVTEVITRSDGRVAGVGTADGDRIAADAVVCTPDLPTVYEKLLPDLTPPRAARTGTYSPSAVVWHVGVRGRPAPGTAHHTIVFGDQWSEAFDSLFHRGELMGDPSRLVTVPSLDHADAAPPGCSTLYVLEPVPNLSGRVDWKRERGPMRERLHEFLRTQGYPDDVVTEELVTPLDWERQGMRAGTPFALAHTFGQTGPFRPPNAERRRPGLFFAGSGTVPGVGVPMVLVSGRLAAERVTDYLSGGRG